MYICCLFSCCSCFCFNQKTAYEMRISDWSSDVCSSDLRHRRDQLSEAAARCDATGDRIVTLRPLSSYHPPPGRRAPRRPVRRSLLGDRKRVVSGKSLSVRVDLGGRRILKKKNKTTTFRPQPYTLTKTTTINTITH